MSIGVTHRRVTAGVRVWSNSAPDGRKCVRGRWGPGKSMESGGRQGLEDAANKRRNGFTKGRQQCSRGGIRGEVRLPCCVGGHVFVLELVRRDVGRPTRAPLASDALARQPCLRPQWV